MRKAQLARVNKYIQLFNTLHTGVVAALNKPERDLLKASNYLQTAQQRAIELGTFIEETEGLGHVTVSYLEQYCEVLFDLNEALTNDLTAEEAGQKLGEILEAIKASVERDIKIKKLAVFLPYKASMWDSLESVWKKLDAESDWDALVIPIPYFDKDSQGNPTQMHYEGGEYPDYVPVIKYDEFDFVSEHPDRAYIHNPYDDYNYVTTVHPFFYSKKIKEYADQLIYIPYFVLSEPDPNNPDALEHIKEFACSPGVIFSDRVILQSENMKRAYVTALTNQYGQETRQTWENKIEGTGSPKLEKVKNLHYEDKDIPEDWLKKIIRPDGSRRKVMFYNTSVVSFINNEGMLDKIENVLKIFYENRERVVLLWRPHPLMESTIKSIMPEKLSRYLKIVEDYKAADWGIFDDTSDVDRAIAISDAYYGDSSSVVQLYQETGKPVMIQNVDVIEED